MLMQNLFRQYYRMLQLVVIVHPFINVIFIRPHFYLLQTALSPHTEKTIGQFTLADDKASNALGEAMANDKGYYALTANRRAKK